MTKQQQKEKKTGPKKKRNGSTTPNWTDTEMAILLSIGNPDKIRDAFSGGKTIKGLEHRDLKQCLIRYYKRDHPKSKKKEDVWDANFEELKQFQQTHPGRTTRVTEKENKKLSIWLMKQLLLAKQHMIRKKKNIVLPKGTDDETWHKRIARLHSIGIEFYKANTPIDDKTEAYDEYLSKLPPPPPFIEERKCNVDGCRRIARESGKCHHVHMGYNYCKVDNCKNPRVETQAAKGLCQKHGAYGWCKFDGCKIAVSSYIHMNGFCGKHGPQRKCKHPECDKTIKKFGANEFCLMHHPSLHYCPEVEATPREVPIEVPQLPPLPDIS